MNPAYLEQGEANTGQRRATHSIGKSAQNLRRQYLSEKDRRHTLSSQAPATSFGQVSETKHNFSILHFYNNNNNDMCNAPYASKRIKRNSKKYCQ